MSIKEFIKDGVPTGYFDYTGVEFKIGDEIEFIDCEGFTCSTKIVIDENFWVGIDAWDRTVGISEMTSSDYRVVVSN